jgi:hypothetical protein
MIFSSVEMPVLAGVEGFFPGVRRPLGAVFREDVFLSALRDAFATGPCFVSGTKILRFLI